MPDHYMNPQTGAVATKDGWWYENEDGDQVNAVDLGEVVKVINVEGEWLQPLTDLVSDC